MLFTADVCSDNLPLLPRWSPRQLAVPSRLWFYRQIEKQAPSTTFWWTVFTVWIYSNNTCLHFGKFTYYSTIPAALIHWLVTIDCINNLATYQADIDHANKCVNIKEKQKRSLKLSLLWFRFLIFENLNQMNKLVKKILLYYQLFMRIWHVITFYLNLTINK